jgi:hypothetical protein
VFPSAGTSRVGMECFKDSVFYTNVFFDGIGWGLGLRTACLPFCPVSESNGPGAYGNMCRWLQVQINGGWDVSVSNSGRRKTGNSSVAPNQRQNLEHWSSSGSISIGLLTETISVETFESESPCRIRSFLLVHSLNGFAFFLVHRRIGATSRLLIRPDPKLP